MSAYLNISVDVNTMVCTACGAESFAWLAEVFACPICGNFEFAVPKLLGNDQAVAEDNKKGASVMAKVEEGSATCRLDGMDGNRSLSDGEEL
ncbi:hypothetical protein SVAN01_01542 [Stagonosporopsis vannaccii]|nr:hypothetical protein SVAN01_01542 [Stagonosporopsis vannaccii]